MFLDPRVRAFIPYVTGPLSKGDRIGTFVFDELTLVNGATTGYAHPLGRTPNGFLPIRYSANVQMWQTDADLAASTATTTQWHASGAGTVSGFWV